MNNIIILSPISTISKIQELVVVHQINILFKYEYFKEISKFTYNIEDAFICIIVYKT